jgi:type IV pilus assembly protein PilN
MSESHRASGKANAAASTAGSTEFGARLRWEHTIKNTAEHAGLAASPKTSADHSGGLK